MEQENVNPFMDNTKKRPTFLTVICILSFVGIGFVIISSLINILNMGNSQNEMMKLQTINSSLFDSVNFDIFFYYSKINNIVGFAAALICLAGVILMWRLKKLGFIIYIVGELAPTVTFFILFSSFFQNPLMSIVLMFSSILMFIVAIVFIIMYAVNLKHMS